MGKRKLSVAIRKYNNKLNKLSDAEAQKLEEIEQLALELMQVHNVSNYNFRFGYGWRYLGMCTEQTIIIQYEHALYDKMTRIKNTILHEIAHAIVGVENGHREVWQLKAKELGVSFTRKYRK